MKQILIDESMGRLNLDIEQQKIRLRKQGIFKDQSVVCIMPCLTEDHRIGARYSARAALSWMNMATPMNQKFYRIPITNMEIGAGYNEVFQLVATHPELGQWKYILTLEADNIPPADGLLKLLENMEDVDVCGGLYWTKGELGQPMIYGDPEVVPLNFWPQVPKADCLQRCNGLGMGFTLFKMGIFRDERLAKPWFKTLQGMESGRGMQMYTQDLYFFEKAVGLGYKMGCDTRVRVGHYDEAQDIIW